MSTNNSSILGTKPIGKLLVSQAVPAAIGILVLSLNMIIDTIFVGKWIGPMAIAAITIVMPIVYLISSIGMAIGVGGASIISRALGANNKDKAQRVFGNQIAISLAVAIVLVVTGLIFKNEALTLFGAKGSIIPPALNLFLLFMAITLIC